SRRTCDRGSRGLDLSLRNLPDRRSQGSARRLRHPGAMKSELGSALERLWQVILSRRNADPQDSYTARLLSRGRMKIGQNLGEEAVETVMEGVKDNPGALVGESADLLYHLLVLWAAAGISPTDVAAELTRREGTSGIAEKRGRANL